MQARQVTASPGVSCGSQPEARRKEVCTSLSPMMLQFKDHSTGISDLNCATLGSAPPSLGYELEALIKQPLRQRLQETPTYPAR
jgi:hypothetical protein